MTENMKKLLELASEDKEFAKEIQAANKETLSRLAKAHGIELTEEDFETSQNEISDDELDAVAGGCKCTCVVGGGGKGDLDSKTCACIAGGGGQWQDGSTRCICVGGGGGD